MKQKKENIVNVIENGKWSDGKATFTDWNNKPFYVESQMVETATGVYFFPKDEEDKNFWKKDIETRLKKMDRLISNRANYGHDGGKAAVFKPNKTELLLTELSKRKADAKVIRRIAEMVKDAPKEIRQALFHNVMMDYNKEFRGGCGKVSEHFDLRDVEIIPPAWTRGWDEMDFFGNYDLHEAMSDLLPSSLGSLGTETKCGYHNELEGKIESYTYKHEHLSRYAGDSGRLVLYYVVRYGASRFDIDEVRYDHLKPIQKVSSVA